MEKSRWQQYKEKNGSTPLDFLNPQTRYASKELQEERMSICVACPEIISITNQCKQCGCFMTAKTKIEVSKCPLGKW
jgi:hypothetical protein